MVKKIFKWLGIVLLGLVVLFLALELFYLPKYWAKREKVELDSLDNSSITIMSSNVRCWAPEDLFKKSWFYRAPLVIDNVRSVQPDVIGFQEVTPMHYKYLTKMLPGYDSILTYRDKTLLSEACPIFYRTDKFELVDKGSFWLSETPDEMSKDWESACYRVCSYVILKQKSDSRELIVFNTHLDHKSEEARQKGIQVVLNKIAEFGDKPAVIMGDFNAKPASETYNFATALFNDANANDVYGSDATYQNWGAKLDTPRIDYFMVSKTGLTVTNYQVIDTLYDGAYPSDHFPILLKMTLN